MTPDPPRRWGRLAVRDRLRAMLPAQTEPLDADEPPSRRWLAMLLSVVVAAVLWFSFSMREDYTVPIRVPVEVVSTPSGQALSESPPTEATVTLQGDGWTLLGLSRSPPPVRISATGASVDMAGAVSESLPTTVRVQSVQPGTVDLALDTRTSRRLPIRLRERIETVPPYDLLRRPRLQPDSVSVTGAQSLLGTLTDWPTELFVAEGVREDLTRTVALSDTFGGLLVPSVRSTTVHVDVGEYTEGSRRLPVEVVNLPPGVPGVRFVPDVVEATFRVPAVGIEYDRAATTDRFRATVDYADIARDTTDAEVPVQARWPSGLNIQEVTLNPSRVGYFIIQRRRPPPAGDEN